MLPLSGAPGLSKGLVTTLPQGRHTVSAKSITDAGSLTVGTICSQTNAGKELGAMKGTFDILLSLKVAGGASSLGQTASHVQCPATPAGLPRTHAIGRGPGIPAEHGRRGPGSPEPAVKVAVKFIDQAGTDRMSFIYDPQAPVCQGAFANSSDRGKLTSEALL